MTQWWSDSKGRFVPIADMPNMHLANAWMKIVRGEYVPPGDPLSADETTALMDAIKAELESRGCELSGASAVPPQTDADAPPQDTEEL